MLGRSYVLPNGRKLAQHLSAKQCIGAGHMRPQIFVVKAGRPLLGKVGVDLFVNLAATIRLRAGVDISTGACFG
jgi:hypothetical protein